MRAERVGLTSRRRLQADVLRPPGRAHLGARADRAWSPSSGWWIQISRPTRSSASRATRGGGVDGPPPSAARAASGRRKASAFRAPSRRRRSSLHGHRISYAGAGSGSCSYWSTASPATRRAGTTSSPGSRSGTRSSPPTCSGTASRRSRGPRSLGAHAGEVRDLLRRSDTSARRSSGTRSAGASRCRSPISPRALRTPGAWSSGGSAPRSTCSCERPRCPAPELVSVLSNRHVRAAGPGRALAGQFGLRTSADLAEMATGHDSLADPETRRAFLATLRAVVDMHGSASWPRTACTWRPSSGAHPVGPARPGSIQSSTPGPPIAGCRAAASRSSTSPGTSPDSTMPIPSPACCATSSISTEPGQLNAETLRERCSNAP